MLRGITRLVVTGGLQTVTHAFVCLHIFNIDSKVSRQRGRAIVYEQCIEECNHHSANQQSIKSYSLLWDDVDGKGNVE